MPSGEQIIENLAAMPLPDCNEQRRRGRDVAAQIEPGRSAFFEHYGVSSEFEYKTQSKRDGRIMYHAHIGLNDVDGTAAALRRIHAELEAREWRLDRAGFALDRRMGLPEAHRAGVAAETGPMLLRPTDWEALAQAAPIQPHLGDFMIGQPNALPNTVQALRIGCTTIGNLSQFFSFEAPGWDDIEATAVNSLQAMAVLAEFRGQGVMLHSYLEDGYGALFRDCATVAAWAMLERYIVEELIGARLSHCIGGLTSDPVKRAGWVLALHRIHGGEQVGSMIYGDTISFGTEFEQNRALVAEYLLWDILVQLHAPSAHAVLPLPVSEALRIPSADEIIEAQLFGRRVEASARRIYPHVDFSAAENFAEQVVSAGERIYRNALAALSAGGVDTRNPLQLLYVLKKIGAVNFENWFAPGAAWQSGIATDVFEMSRSLIEKCRPQFAEPGFRGRVDGQCFIVASSDVHEHAAGALAQLLGETGAHVIYLGAEQDPLQLVDALRQHDADALLLSTHNGMALEYARRLRELMDESGLRQPVVIGGVLNQKTADQALPVPVVDELKALGMSPATALPALTRLLEFKSLE